MTHLRTFLGLVVALLAASVLRAQTVSTPVIPAGLIYQAATQTGVQYIDPISGQAILSQRAALNWHNVATQVFGDASIGLLTAGLAGVIHMPVSAETALGAFHAYYDHTIAPLVAAGAPSPTAIAPVLPMNGTVAPSSTQCVENSIYAVYNKSAAPVGPVLVGGLNVTFTPQGAVVLKNSAGQRIKGFEIVNVLACLPVAVVLPTSAPPVSPVPSVKKAAWIPEGDLYALNVRFP